jgi:antitoxin component of RelBE/YafQ-DinJ toxin-antitoxin module
MISKKKTTVQIDRDLMQQVKLVAIEYGMPYSAVIEILISEAFKDDTIRTTINFCLEQEPILSDNKE